MSEEWTEIEGSGGNIYWLPENKKDEITGTLTGSREGDYGTNFELTEPDGTLRLCPANIVLQEKLKKVEFGSEVRIVFEGYQGRTKLFTVFSRPADTTNVASKGKSMQKKAQETPAEHALQLIAEMDVGKGAPLKAVSTTLQAETGISADAVDAIILALKNQGMITEAKNGLLKVVS